MIWGRGDLATWQSKYFRAKEFECQCGVCQRQVLDDKLIAMLDEVRDLVGIPIKINSGFRCAKRQDDLRKQGLETATGKSSHENGQAADIACADMAALEKACLTVFAKHSVGVARTFIHVDVRANGPRRWGYSK
jgi:zinc D-Ala-D-Ala carboxypeptidase